MWAQLYKEDIVFEKNPKGSMLAEMGAMLSV